MISISINDLSFSFGTRQILDKISFSLEENDKLGIVGVNGCGKSTLFRLILGELEPDGGNIFIANGKQVGILTQDGAFEVSGSVGRTALEQMYTAFPELLALEARLSALEAEQERQTDPSRQAALAAEYTELHARYSRGGGHEFRGRCAAMLAKMGYDEAAMKLDIAELSGGQRTRLALSRLLCREPDIFLLDEPTNHLDIETLTWLEEVLVAYKKCVIIISHDRYFLDRVTNKTLALEHGRATLYRGGYTATLEQRRIDRENAEKRYRDQQKEIARQEAYIARQRAWNRERNIIAAESRLKLLAKMDRLEKPKEAPKAIKMRFGEGLAGGSEVLTARSLGMAYGSHVLFEKLNFLIKRGERVFVVGPNGCGKSTLLGILLGRIAPTEGRVELGYHAEIGYYDQENQNLDPENTVLEELWSAYPDRPEVEIRQTLAAFRFLYDDTERLVGKLSGGERVRLTLAKLVLSRVNLLVLDEPTNHLDIDSREALEEALRAFDGTVVVVSHDRYLIDKLATRLIEPISPGFGGGAYDYSVTHVGHGYSEFGAFKREHAPGAAAKSPEAEKPSEAKEQYLKNKQAAGEERRRRSLMERLSREKDTLEARLEEIDRELYGPAATDYERAAELEAEKQTAEERLLYIYEEIGV